MALGIDETKRFAWIDGFPLKHIFTTTYVGNFLVFEDGVLAVYRLAGDLMAVEKAREIPFSVYHLVPSSGRKIYDSGRGWQIVEGQSLLLEVKEEAKVITIFPADCYPIFIGDTKQRIIGLVHGSAVEVFRKTLLKTLREARERFKISPEEILIGIGPGIKKCCYPIDLLGRILNQLKKFGVLREHIYIAGVCTSCSVFPNSKEYIFYSHRRSKRLKEPEARFAAVLTSRLIGSG